MRSRVMLEQLPVELINSFNRQKEQNTELGFGSDFT